MTYGSDDEITEARAQIQLLDWMLGGNFEHRARANSGDPTLIEEPQEEDPSSMEYDSTGDAPKAAAEPSLTNGQIPGN